MTDELTAAEIEALALVAEEAAEVVQVIGKIMRFGYTSQHPDHPRGPDNRRRLEIEIGDFLGAVELLQQRTDVSRIAVQKYKQLKLHRMPMYLKHNTVVHHG